jgi:hypothetical protein
METGVAWLNADRFPNEGDGNRPIARGAADASEQVQCGGVLWLLAQHLTAQRLSFREAALQPVLGCCSKPRVR